MLYMVTSHSSHNHFAVHTKYIKNDAHCTMVCTPPTQCLEVQRKSIHFKNHTLTYSYISIDFNKLLNSLNYKYLQILYLSVKINGLNLNFRI